MLFIITVPRDCLLKQVLVRHEGSWHRSGSASHLDMPEVGGHDLEVVIYDVIGATYAQTRRADPRIAAAIGTALGDVTSVVNIGAGAGSYEPANTVLAVEPSRVMISQRRSGAAPPCARWQRHYRCGINPLIPRWRCLPSCFR